MSLEPSLRPTHVFYLTFMNYSIQNLLLLSDMLNTAGRDVWMSTLLSLAFAVVASVMLWVVEQQYPGKTLFDILQEKLSRGLQVPLFLLLGLYLIMLCILTTADLGEFVSIGFIQETPLWVIIVMFSTVISYSLRRGIVGLANVAGILTFATIFSGTTMSVAITQHRDMKEFLPLLEHGFLPVLYGSFLFIPIWAEIFFIGFLPRRNIGQKIWLKTYILVSVINIILFLGHTIGPISVFGLEQAQNLNFPALSSVKVISLGFIDRFDIYGLMLMIFGSLIRVGLYLYLALAMFQGAFGAKIKLLVPYKTGLVAVAGVVLASGSILAFRNSVFFDSLVAQLVVYSTVLYAAFLFISLFLWLLRKRRFVSHL